MTHDAYGTWEIVIPHGKDGTPTIPHDTKVKICMTMENGEIIERIPAWIHRAVQDLAVSPVYEGVFWNPPKKYQFLHPRPARPASLRIYEAHVGIASPHGRVATYKEFTQNVIPRIADTGYNAIQLMAIMEHPYYASFGYQVTNFFAPSSRYGSPEDLMELIDTAHSLNIVVLLDVVHSHVSDNVLDGINKFDGTGSKGSPRIMGSRLFNYGHHEVLRFLLSNLRYWMDEYNFDGFRFDGVTSMLYLHHGIGTGFSGNYHEYFGGSVDTEAMYLACLHFADPSPKGVGFDYRLSMAIPDMWIKILKEKADDQWEMGNIVFTLTNRRWKEPAIAYTESHDQALVGDKTLAFWLMDKEMYEFMSDMSPLTPIIDRGIALHKMIRMITYALGGEGYLTFMGNEFGHPEWLYLNNWERAMHHLESQFSWLNSGQFVSLKNEQDKVVVFERGNLLWIFNFHPSQSFTDYRVGTQWNTLHTVALHSDRAEFGGHSRIADDGQYIPTHDAWNDRPNWIQVYIPCRTVLILKHE
ncbi:hypothetical protein BSLG_007529 [Batrachochytrium salamandrivorans]|nr:hypothetical protein BSLG_007529 [Batrachochytrium salamandrivorans]